MTNSASIALFIVLTSSGHAGRVQFILPLPRSRGMMAAKGGVDMLDVRLTRDAEYLLCALYDVYLVRRKGGEPRSDAALFGGSEFIQERIVQELPTQDIDDAARELSALGLAVCSFGDDELDALYLSNAGISFMESRFSGKVDALLNRLAALRAIILG